MSVPFIGRNRRRYRLINIWPSDFILVPLTFSLLQCDRRYRPHQHVTAANLIGQLSKISEIQVAWSTIYLLYLSAICWNERKI